MQMLHSEVYFMDKMNPVLLALIATAGTWFATAFGSSFVFIFRTINKRIMDCMLGFAAGVMIAASYWSLLAPSIEMSANLGITEWIPPVTGFLAGGLFLYIVDKIIPHLHKDFPINEAEGIRTGFSRSILLVFAITLHNIPEGLAVGVAFGAVAANLPSADLTGAIALAIGIAIQNIPEGAAVSVPLRREGFSRIKCFWYGQLSGIVEPIAAVAGAALVMMILPILPYALAFAAGAMIYVVVEELIPESQIGKNTDLSTLGTMAGFAVMMMLDVAFG